jgi:hypothetical protein
MRATVAPVLKSTRFARATAARGSNERVGTLTPPAACTVLRADEVVEQNERRASGARPLPDAAHATGGNGRLQERALEPIVEQILERHRQHAQQLEHVGSAERAELAPESDERRQLAER